MNGRWSQFDDASLLQMGRTRATWQAIATALDRTPSSCQERYKIIGNITGRDYHPRIAPHAIPSNDDDDVNHLENAHIETLNYLGGFPRFGADANGLMTRDLVRPDGSRWRNGHPWG